MGRNRFITIVRISVPIPGQAIGDDLDTLRALSL